MIHSINIKAQNNEQIEFAIDISAIVAVLDLSSATWRAQIRRGAADDPPVAEFEVVGVTTRVVIWRLAAATVRLLSGIYEWDAVYTLAGVPRVAAGGTLTIEIGVTR